MKRFSECFGVFLLLILMCGLAAASVQDAQKTSVLYSSDLNLWQFLRELPNSQEAQIFYGVMLAAIAGHCASWLWKFANKQVGCFWDYMIKENVLRTAAALMGTVVLCLTAITSGVFEAPSGEFVGWLNVLWWGAQAGAGVDLAVNRGSSTAATTPPTTATPS